ncbi:MAG: hypothetical protein F6K24_47255 [Okeania sp. SIO2D1]|nr:hypothetical protein [Okeania sp. SIO2D1]
MSSIIGVVACQAENSVLASQARSYHHRPSGDRSSIDKKKQAIALQLTRRNRRSGASS